MLHRRTNRTPVSSSWRVIDREIQVDEVWKSPLGVLAVDFDEGYEKVGLVAGAFGLPGVGAGGHG